MSAAVALVSFRTPVLPWAVSADDELRFKRIARRVLTRFRRFDAAIERANDLHASQHAIIERGVGDLVAVVATGK